jgi:hypothetical protein
LDLDSRLAGRSAWLRTNDQLALKRPWLPWLAVVLLTLPALGPLLRPEFFVSDDGLFHLYRIAAVVNAWHQGVLYPRLFPDFGFGYGQAVLNFYAPLAYVPGALLASLGVGPAEAAQITLGLGFILAALATYGFVNSLWGPLAGLLAAVAYTYFPYHLADAYMRGALPEQFAFIWPPLILWAYTVSFLGNRASFEAGIPGRAVLSPLRRAAAPLLWSALAWAGLVYTHNLTALMFAPVAVVYLLLLTAITRRSHGTVGTWRLLVASAGSLLLAMLLSAPLWLPFLAESRAVGLGLGPSAGYRQHLAPLNQAIQLLPFYRYRVQHGGVADHPLSWLTAALLLLVLVLALIRWGAGRRGPASDGIHRTGSILPGLIVFGLGLALVSAFLITASSLPVWQAFEFGLAQLQYPWRFLAMTAMGMALVAGAFVVLLPRTWRVPMAGLVGALMIAVGLAGLAVQPLSVPAPEAWAPDRMWREDAAAGQVGATWTGEFLPQTVSEQRWALGRSTANAVDRPGPAARPAVVLDRLGLAQTTLTMTTAAPQALRLHQFYLAGWAASIDGQPAATYPSGELGLVTVDVPAGTHQVTAYFGPTPSRTVGALLATLGAVVWAALALYVWRAGRTQQVGNSGGRLRQDLQESAAETLTAREVGNSDPTARAGPGVWLLAPAAVALLALALVLNLNRLGFGQRTWSPRPVQAALGDVALLLGYDAALARGENALDVTLYWLALRDVATDYKAFVHLLGPDGQVLAQHDGDPGGGFTPTTRWRSGEIIVDRHRLSLAQTPAAGEFRLKAGLYRNPPLQNLPVDPPAADGRADLGPIRLPAVGGTP